MKFNKWLKNREKTVSEWEAYIDDDGYAHDDEGNVEFVGKHHPSGTYGLHDFPRTRGEYSPRPRPSVPVDEKKVDALNRAIGIRNNEFLSSILSQVKSGRVLTDNQKKIVRQIFYKLRMKEDADLFR